MDLGVKPQDTWRENIYFFPFLCTVIAVVFLLRRISTTLYQNNYTTQHCEARNEEETPKVCIIGAGMSGMCAAIQLKKQLGLTSFTMFESNADVGGTWQVNKYPGCACDVPSHLYSFSFEPKSDWSRNYAYQPEILNYLKSVAEKHKLYSKIKFNTDVKSLIWEEHISKWRVTTVEKSTGVEEQILFDIIINGTGILRIPNIPPEFGSFQGQIVHSARWDPTVNLNNKVVAVVGTGASAVQIIQVIASQVKALHVFQREAVWIFPLFQFEFSETMKRIFSKITSWQWMYRGILFLFYDIFLFSGMKKNSIVNKTGIILANTLMRLQIPNNKELCKKLTPLYPYGCKRISMSNDYFTALALPQVSVHTSKITKVVGNTILTEDENVENIDILILATGFRSHDYFEPMQITGRNSEDILLKWKTEGPQTYLGIASSSMPNHFRLLGPNTFTGHNSTLFMIECQANFAVKVISEMMKRNSCCVAIKPSAEKEFMEEITELMKSMLWGDSQCTTWYKDSRGVVTHNYPASCFSYWKKTRKVDFSKFDFIYKFKTEAYKF